MAAKFVHLHVHSHYSLLQGLAKLDELVEAAKAEGCDALALTDRGSLYGTIEFIKECKAAGIKPILGVDAHIGDGNRLVLLAEHEAGYKNLLALVTAAHLAEHEGEPLYTREMLAQHHEGLLAIVPARSKVEGIKEIFGAENFYTDVPLREVFYLKPEDRRAWETLRAIERGGQEDTSLNDDDEYYFTRAAEMEEQFSEADLKKTLDIAARCNVELKLGSWIFPPYEIPKDSTYNDEFRKIIEAGLKNRKLEETPEVRERIEYEYKIITDKGYAPYFLVVSDLLRFAKENGILTTTRGSAAGSFISYLTGITNINPMDYKLPFERFLNPERPKAPDIDMDFADNRRDEVIDYARRKYGHDRVAQIGTFGTMLARGVVRDVARALGYPYALGDRIAKEIPMGSQGFPMTLDRALEENPELAKLYKNDEQVQEIINLGKKIEGCARHISVHAAGVVIAPGPIVQYAPLQRDPKGGKLITQYDMYSITDEYGGVGLLKFDFLGIRNLAILANSVELVEKTRGEKLNIREIPMDDVKTFEMLARGETEATFQLGGAGMTRYLKELRPTNVHDINAMVALFRPGPMETIPQYIERKRNPNLVTFLDPRMKKYLSFSYGVLVYQDDVLLTAIEIAGYSWLEADMLRKAMGKKIPAEMEKQKVKFFEGAIKHGMDRPKVEKLWALIEPFAAYGFGKAHAASYGNVAYQTAYMKANYPVQYMAAVLTAESGDVDTIAIMVAECKRMGIPILAPDINESFGDFTVILGKNSKRTAEAAALGGDTEADSIRFGLYSIKNFGAGVADAIIAERKAGGRFTSLADFLSRVKDQSLNKKGLESLIQCGALDSFGERGQMLANIELLLAYHRDATKEQSHTSLFADLGESVSGLVLKPAPEASMRERLTWEKELLGLYISGHPLDQYKEKLSKRPMTIGEMKQKILPGMNAVAAGMVEDVRVILTRGGDQMAFIKIMDTSGWIEAVVFPKNYVQFKEMLKPENCIALKGRVSNRNGELSMVAEAMKTL